MAAPYDLNDDSVVVIIGSGAGGGTLGNELAQKGIDTVILEEVDATRRRISSTMNGPASASSHGSTSARRRATGGWRRIFPACLPGS